jgi:L-threonylcarbamoyladenylate synthase
MRTRRRPARPIDQAARALEAGLLVALPTETVYGLGADAENPAAVAAIYAAKGRPQDHPVIVHVAPEAPTRLLGVRDPAGSAPLAEAFWPGPLTMILKRAPNIPDAVSGGQDTVGIRCPSHPVAIACCKPSRAGRAASRRRRPTSSATSARPRRPARARRIRPDGSRIAGARRRRRARSGSNRPSSTCLAWRPTARCCCVPAISRAEQIAAVIDLAPAALPDAAAPRASGTLESHYAPHTPVALQDTATLADAIAGLHQAGRKAAR